MDERVVVLTVTISGRFRMAENKDYKVLVDGFNNEEEEDDMEDLRVTLDIGDGKEIECGILTIFDLGDGSDQDYIVLVPVDEDGDYLEETDIYIYKYFEDENGEPSIEMLDDDEEFDKVNARFEQLMDEADDED